MSFHNSATCPRKERARYETIINIYRELFQEKLPKEKQYWTLAGPCFDENGDLGKCSEIYQMVSSGLIEEEQYHGIDNGKEIIEKNRIACPRGNFHHGDFVTQIEQACIDGKFNPAIINADYTRMKNSSVNDTCNIMYLTEYNKLDDFMIVMNFPWNNPYSGKLQSEIDPKEILELFQKNQRFNYCWTNGWKMYPKCYIYGGTGERSKTTMCSFILWKH